MARAAKSAKSDSPKKSGKAATKASKKKVLLCDFQPFLREFL